MPRHPDHPGLYVEVRGWSGWGLNQFPDQEATERTGAITTYIQVRDDMEFEIAYQFYNPFPFDRDVCVTLWIDGIGMRKISERKADIKKERFRFKNVSSTAAQDDHESTVSKKRGSVKVAFHFGTAGIEPKEPWGCPLQELQSVSERKTKDQEPMSIQVGPGRTTKMEKPVFHDFEWDGEAFATFVFKYRYRDELADLGLIPRNYVRRPLPKDSDVKTEPDVKAEPKVKNEPDIKTEPNVITEPDPSTASRVSSEPNIKTEPGTAETAPLNSIAQDDQDAGTSGRNEEARIKQEDKTEDDVAPPPPGDSTPQHQEGVGAGAASAGGDSIVPAKRELKDVEGEAMADKRIKQEEEDE